MAKVDTRSTVNLIRKLQSEEERARDDEVGLDVKGAEENKNKIRATTTEAMAGVLEIRGK